MKTTPHSSLPPLAGAACLCLALVSCSTHPSNAGGTALLKTKHPNLELRPANLSSRLLISDADLQGGSRMHVTMARAGEKVAGSMPYVLALPVAAFFTVGSVLVAPQIVLPVRDADPVRRTLLDGTCPRIKLSGSEIRYRSAKASRGIELARAVGDARIEVSDQHGSYYCRADEIHYRAATKEIILHGRASVSAVYAPGIHDFGLARINLAHCTLEYSSR